MFLHVWRTDMRCTRRSRGGRAQDIPLDVGSNNKPRLQYLLAGLRRKKDLQYYNPDFSTPRTVSIAFRHNFFIPLPGHHPQCSIRIRPDRIIILVRLLVPSTFAIVESAFAMNQKITFHTPIEFRCCAAIGSVLSGFSPASPFSFSASGDSGAR